MSEQNKGMVVVDYDAATFSDAENNVLNKDQFNKMMAKTPSKYIHQRKAKGGGEWDYVTGGYVKKILNVAFGWNWDFEIKHYDFDLNVKAAFVHGRLTVRSNGHTVVKEQFGRADIKFKTEWVKDPKDPNKNVKQTTTEPLDIGNDLKAAATDALKKCASELGICNDIYAKDDWNEVKAVDDSDFDEVPMEVLKKIRSFTTEAELKDYAMLHENRYFVQQKAFQNEYNDKLQELWQDQTK